MNARLGPDTDPPTGSVTAAFAIVRRGASGSVSVAVEGVAAGGAPGALNARKGRATPAARSTAELRTSARSCGASGNDSTGFATVRCSGGTNGRTGFDASPDTSTRFSSALICGANERFEGGDPTLGSSLAGARSRIGLIFQWALVSATVSMIIRQIQERGGLLFECLDVRPENEAPGGEHGREALLELLAERAVLPLHVEEGDPRHGEPV